MNGATGAYGTAAVPLALSYSDVVANNREVFGQFMYPTTAYRRLVGLVRARLPDISLIRPRCYPLTDLPEAMDAAATSSNMEWVVVQP